MEFKYSVSILFSHAGYILRILVWLALCLLVSAAIGVAILLPIYHAFVKTTAIAEYVSSIMHSFRLIWDGSSSLRGAGLEIVTTVMSGVRELTKDPGLFVAFLAALLFIYSLYCFLTGLSHYAVSDIVNKLMSSNLHFGFASSMALNFKKGLKYSLCRLTVILPIDILFYVTAFFLTVGLYTVISFFALPIMIIIGVAFYSLRAVLLSGWLPRLLFNPEERIYTAFARSLTQVRLGFKDYFKSYVLIFSCAYALAATLALPTGGIALLLLPSMYYFILRAVELIGYYKVNGMSFYVDRATVINTVDYGLRTDNQTDNSQAYDAKKDE